MTNTLTLLGAKDITTLPVDIQRAGKLVDGMQEIYVKMPDSAKKEFFAGVIAESVRILIGRMIPILGAEAEALRKENEQLPQEQRVPIPMPQQPRSQPAPRPTPAPKKQPAPAPQPPKKDNAPTPPQDKKKYTMDDMRALEAGDKFVYAVSDLGIELEYTVESKDEEGLNGKYLQKWDGKIIGSQWKWEKIEKAIEKNLITDIIKAKPEEEKVATLEDIKNASVGDTIVKKHVLGEQARLVVVLKGQDGLSADVTLKDDNQLYKGENYDWQYFADEIKKGYKYSIIKKADDKKEEQKYATVEDVANLKEGDTLYNEVAKLTITVERKDDETDGYWTKVADGYANDEREDVYISISRLQKRIEAGTQYILTRAQEEPKKSNVTMEDIKELEAGDIVEIKSEETGNIRLTIKKILNKGRVTQCAIADIYNYEDGTTSKGVECYLVWFKGRIEDGEQFEIIKNAKPKKTSATREDIMALEAGDTVEVRGIGVDSVKLTVNKVKDGGRSRICVTADILFYETGELAKNVDLYMAWFSERLAAGAQIEIIKGTAPEKRGRKKKEEPTGDEATQLKKLADRLKNLTDI